MDAIAEIKSFARDFVNGVGRTPERKRLIQQVYYKRFGARLRIH